MRYFLINKRAKDGEYIPVEFDYAGNTYVLPPDSRTEVTRDEAHAGLARHQTVGVSLEEVPEESEAK